MESRKKPGPPPPPRKLKPSISLPLGNPSLQAVTTSEQRMKAIRSANKGADPPLLPARKLTEKVNLVGKKRATISSHHNISSPVQFTGTRKRFMPERVGPPLVHSRDRTKSLSAEALNVNGRFERKEMQLLPPPLPERPKDLLPVAPSLSEPTSTKETPTKLGDIVKNVCLPFRFQVLQGYCSNTTDVNMSTGDVYDVHTKEESTVAIVTGNNGMTVKIPHSSAQKIGIIFNPSNDYEKGLEGHTFRNIADLVACSSVPKVVCATQEARSSGGKYLVEENEILVVQHVHRNVFRSKKSVTVFSMLSKSEKTLPFDCAGYFSTKPSLIRLSLLQIAVHVPDPFPVKAVVYSAGENVISPVKHGVVTIAGCNKRTTLVVSSVSTNVSALEASEHFNLTLDDDLLDLEVSVQSSHLPEIQLERNSSVEAVESDDAGATKFTNGEPEQDEVDGYTDIAHPPPTENESDGSDEYTTVTRDQRILTRESKIHPSPSSPHAYDDVIIVKEGQDVSPSASVRAECLGQLSAIQQQIKQLNQQLASIQSQVNELTTQSAPRLQGEVKLNDNRQDNKDYVSKLDTGGVCGMFEAMGMGQYKSVIERESITGDILLDLDDRVLEEELGIKSKIHRLRLQRIISGQQPATRTV